MGAVLFGLSTIFGLEVSLRRVRELEDGGEELETGTLCGHVAWMDREV